jgi:hypothetical protein
MQRKDYLSHVECMSAARTAKTRSIARCSHKEAIEIAFAADYKRPS